jgi:hypothetical protein
LNCVFGEFPADPVFFRLSFVISIRSSSHSQMGKMTMANSEKTILDSGSGECSVDQDWRGKVLGSFHRACMIMVAVESTGNFPLVGKYSGEHGKVVGIFRLSY